MRPTHAPDPPRGLRGIFTSADDARQENAVASGPLRIRPLAVARPVDPEDLATLVRWAEAEGQALVPRGAGTGMPGGNVGPGVSVDLTHWREMDPREAGDGIVRVQPGVVANRIQTEAARSGHFMPALPSSSDRCTVGGMVANNAAGARTFGYGATRDWVEALEIVTPSGELLRLERGAAAPAPFAELRAQLAGDRGVRWLEKWPDVRKNASGYALDRFLADGDPVSLFVGSEGTLGFVTRAELRLAPEPERRILVLFPVSDLDALVPAAAAAAAVGAAACEFFGRRFLEIAGLESDPRTEGLTRGAEALLLIELDGSIDEMRSALDELRAAVGPLAPSILEVQGDEERAELWSIRHAASPVIAAQADRGLVSMQFIEDSVVPPVRLADYLRDLQRILADEETDAVLFGHAGDGNVHVNPLVDVSRPDWRARVARILERTADLVADLGGTLSGEHGDGRIRGVFHERVWGADIAEAFRMVKSQIDPAGIMNPGVVVALPGQDPLEGLSPLGGRR